MCVRGFFDVERLDLIKQKAESRDAERGTAAHAIWSVQNAAKNAHSERSSNFNLPLTPCDLTSGRMEP